MAAGVGGLSVGGRAFELNERRWHHEMALKCGLLLLPVHGEHYKADID